MAGDENVELFEHTGKAQIGLPARGSACARAGSEWLHSGSDGFRIRPLMEDGPLRTWLMQVDPGTSAELHAHAEIEQIYVLEGTFTDQDSTYGPGDLVVRAPGAMHTASSETGALVLLTYVPSPASPAR